MTTRSVQLSRPRSVDCSLLLNSSLEQYGQTFTDMDVVQAASKNTIVLNDEMRRPATDKTSRRTPSVVVSSATPELNKARLASPPAGLLNGSAESVGSDIIDLQFDTYLVKHQHANTGTTSLHVREHIHLLLRHNLKIVTMFSFLLEPSSSWCFRTSRLSCFISSFN